MEEDEGFGSGAGPEVDETDVSFNIIGQVILFNIIELLCSDNAIQILCKWICKEGFDF